MNVLHRHPDYARLFAAQIVALSGTGLMTVALGLLAFEIAGPAAGAVLGLTYTIKMVAYVGLSPIAQAWVARLPRKTVLIVADLVRAGTALCLPFVDQVWQICVLIFVLQAASATFTPAYQATLPDVLPDERDYTRALSLSRLAYDMENLTSPAIAGLLLTMMSFDWLFAFTALGFVGSAMLVRWTRLPKPDPGAAQRPFRERLTRGVRLYLATPRLRGLWALTLTGAAASAFVLVNTVVLVRGEYGAGESALALAMAAFGAGSMAVALALPSLLDHVPDRPVMLTAGLGYALFMLVCGGWLWLAGLPPVWAGLGLMALAGAFYAAVLTPGGRLLKRSSHSEDRPALFAAQFALSHVCWLVTYPLAGWAGGALGMGPALVLLGALGLASALAAGRLWDSRTEAAQVHEHPELPPDHPHLQSGHEGGHRHRIVVDDLHQHLPR